MKISYEEAIVLSAMVAPVRFRDSTWEGLVDGLQWETSFCGSMKPGPQTSPSG